ncbi:MAG: hypothetical protein QM778_27710 [Myxococcales bacterium]
MNERKVGRGLGLQSARGAGLLRFGDPAEAMRQGKGFEDQVIQQLKNGAQ